MQDMESLYQEYAKQVYRYLFTLCHEEHMAEELTQETFYRAMKSIKNYDGTCKIYVWLCQIGKHVWYQELDRQRRKGTLELKNGARFDLLVVGDAKESRSNEDQNGEVTWEHVYTVKKVLHNPFDDVGDSMTIGGKVGDGSRRIFRLTDGELICEEGKLITGK